jgi:hypothetical protein
MMSRDPHRPGRWKSLWIVGGALLLLAATIDDWRRDFTTNHAEISFKSDDKRLRPFVSELPRDRVVEAVKWSARRVGGMRFEGVSADGADTFIRFVREGRVLPFTDDVRMRVRDRGDDRVVTGEARSRSEFGDLGRNPRTLRRLLDELADVIEGAE